MSKLTGRITIILNGRQVKSMPGATYTAGGDIRTPKISDQGVAGHTVSNGAPKVDFKIPHGPGVSIKDIQAMDDVTLVFKPDAGAPITLDHAFCGPAPVLSGGDLACTFYGMSDNEE